jgi:hypothetical protein
MTLRRLTMLPLVLVVLLFGLHAVIAPLTRQGHDLVSTVSKLAAFVGGIVAARTFARGDYMRRAFAFEAAVFGLLAFRDGTAMIAPIRAALEAANAFQALWRTLFVAANLCGVVGAVMMARAATLADFDSEGKRLRRVAWFLLAALVGIALTGRSFVVAALDIYNGQMRGLTVFIGSLADLCAFVLTVPIVRLAYGLRGGLLYVPWALIATARMLWIVYDVLSAAPPWLLQDHRFVVAEEVTRTLACFYSFAAGLAFRRTFAESAETE